MLTATYSLVAITNEQNAMRRMLCKLQNYVQNTWKDLENLSRARIEAAFGSLTQIDGWLHNRKVEIYLIPTIRRVTREADGLLAELDLMTASAVHSLYSLKEQIGMAFDGGRLTANELMHSMEVYCHHALDRLAREEKELFPLARRIFSIEEWFVIAERFLSADGQKAFGRRRTPTPAYPVHIVPAQHMALQ